MDRIWEFLDNTIGRRTVNVLLILIVVLTAIFTIDRYIVTPDCLTNTTNELYAQINTKAQALENKTVWNHLRIIDFQLESLRRERLQLQNFIDTQQAGQATMSQQTRLKEIDTTINDLNNKRSHLLSQLE